MPRSEEPWLNIFMLRIRTILDRILNTIRILLLKTSGSDSGFSSGSDFYIRPDPVFYLTGSGSVFFIFDRIRIWFQIRFRFRLNIRFQFRLWGQIRSKIKNRIRIFLKRIRIWSKIVMSLEKQENFLKIKKKLEFS
jgi:hypothetical protein